MAERLIVGTFDLKTGKVKIEAHGFRGRGCEKAMQPYEAAALAVDAPDAIEKPEYNASTSGESDSSTVRA